MNRIKWLRLPVALALLCSALACHPCVSVVAVPAARFRTETAPADRLHVPLSPEDRARLVSFLRAGGDRHRPSTVIVDPAAETRYATLLVLLEEPELTIQRFAKVHLFQGQHTDEIIDSREESPPTRNRPIACTDGNYWWIAYSDHDHVTGILVTRVFKRHPEQPGGGSQ